MTAKKQETAENFIDVSNIEIVNIGSENMNKGDNNMNKNNMRLSLNDSQNKTQKF